MASPRQGLVVWGLPNKGHTLASPRQGLVVWGLPRQGLVVWGLLRQGLVVWGLLRLMQSSRVSAPLEWKVGNDEGTGLALSTY